MGGPSGMIVPSPALPMVVPVGVSRQIAPDRVYHASGPGCRPTAWGYHCDLCAPLLIPTRLPVSASTVSATKAGDSLSSTRYRVLPNGKPGAGSLTELAE